MERPTIIFYGVFSNPDSTNHSQARELGKLGRVIQIDFRAKKDFVPVEADLIIYSKAETVPAEVVRKSEGVKCLWYMDPVNGNFNQALIEKIKLVDYSCFNLYPAMAEANKYVNKDRLFLLEEGFDSEVDTLSAAEAFERNAAFIGSLHNASRQDYHRKVGFEVLSGVSRETHALEVSKTRINLNFSHASDRVYKVMAAGSFLLSEPWPCMPFVAGKHLDTFTSAEELELKIDYYLTHHDERQKIATAGYVEVQRFTRQRWAEKIAQLHRQFK